MSSTFSSSSASSSSSNPSSPSSSSTSLWTTFVANITSLFYGKDESSLLSDKIWDLEWKFIDAETQKEVGNVLDTLEEAFYLKGTQEGKEYAQELTKSTGFLLTYKILLEEKHGRTLEEEVKSNGFGNEWKKASDLVTRGITKNRLYSQKGMEHDYLLALSLYTSNGCYKLLNQSLREKNKLHDTLKYSIFASCFIKGFRMLPSYWGTLYRGAAFDPAPYKAGRIVLWHGFTSCSKSRDAAENFMRRCEVTPTSPWILFIIQSKSGRSLQDLSFYPAEDEVAFRPFTSFKVAKVIHIDDRWEIELEEAFPDTRGRKVLLWVDDAHGQESKLIMDLCERNGVTCVHLKSTSHALEFLNSGQARLLQRKINRLRLITDMARIEEDGDKKELVVDAGLQLVKRLADEFGYRETLLVYTGPQYLEDNRKKFREAGLSHVYVTKTMTDAIKFASFEQFEPSRESPSSPPSPSSPSSSPSPSSPTSSSTPTSSPPLQSFPSTTSA